MFEIGRICIKLAGRDAGKKCVVLSEIKDNLVLIDGETRRRNCNINHLEPLNDVIKIKANASHAEVVELFKKAGMEPMQTKPKKAAAKPKKTRKLNANKPVKEKKQEAKTTEKEKAKSEEKQKAEKKPKHTANAKKSQK